jgi:anti-anti-sigma factor
MIDCSERETNGQRIEVCATNGKACSVTLIDRSIVSPFQIESLRNELFEVASRTQKQHLLVDLSNVEIMSSAFLTVLTLLNRQMQVGRGSLRVFNVRSKIVRAFAITGIDQVLDIRKTRSDALRGLR